MRLKRTTCKTQAVRRRSGGFTLAEVLAALLFMSIVIPVALQGLSIASRAGEVAARKAVAARIGEKVINEQLVTGQWSTGQSGTVQDGQLTYNWKVSATPWDKDKLQVITAKVTYTVRGEDFEVRMSTLSANPTQ